jgi:hypothetical protein
MNPERPKLSPAQVSEFLRQIAHTRDHEVDCGTCIEFIGEFAEKKLTGCELDTALASIEHHLSLCPECTEEYLALKKILEAAR